MYFYENNLTANQRIVYLKVMKMLIIILFFILSGISGLFASQFDELDKAPEGAHKGQLLIGGIISFGKPYGDIISAEHNFTKNTIYTFEDSSISKKLWVDHLSFLFGASAEYMPIDHLGVKLKLRRMIIIQRTLFGANYENWRGTTFMDFSFAIGPSYHVTTRKRWDFTVTPVIGYSIARYNATPVAARLIENYEGKRSQSASGLVLGTEVNFTAYFSGGLFISLGFDWTMNMVKFDSAYSLTQPNGNQFFPANNESQIHHLSFVISAGYAFSN